MATPRVPVNGVVLQWARKRAGMSEEEAAHAVNVSVDRLRTWESTGEKDERSYPTLAQLRHLAARYRQTLATFLLPEPPVEVEGDATRPPDFRRRNRDERVPLRVLAEMDKAAERRKVFVELAAPEPAKLPYTTLGDLQAATVVLRDRLGVTLREQLAWPREQVLRHWVEAVERLGVLVFQMSNVDPDDVQGFSLYYDVAPVITLNGADSAAVRTFTLLHELGHLLTRTGGVCQTTSHDSVEQRCNAFAAETLMPQADFVRVATRESPIDQIPALAGRYRVSYSAIAVRLRALGYIDQDTLESLLDEAAARARAARDEKRASARGKKGGPPHHLTHLRNLGARYVYTVLDAVDDDRISPVDASYYLESKWSTIRHMEADLLGKAAEA